MMKNHDNEGKSKAEFNDDIIHVRYDELSIHRGDMIHNTVRRGAAVRFTHTSE